jgi:hypothetical protein
VHMGFPQKRVLDHDAFFSGLGGEYVCPRCSSRVEVLPLFDDDRLIYLQNYCLCLLQNNSSRETVRL